MTSSTAAQAVPACTIQPQRRTDVLGLMLVWSRLRKSGSGANFFPARCVDRLSSERTSACEEHDGQVRKWASNSRASASGSSASRYASIFSCRLSQLIGTLLALSPQAIDAWLCAPAPGATSLCPSGWSALGDLPVAHLLHIA